MEYEIAIKELDLDSTYDIDFQRRDPHLTNSGDLLKAVTNSISSIVLLLVRNYRLESYFNFLNSNQTKDGLHT